MNNNTIFKIIDSVDLFLSNERYLMVYYMNSRQRKSFKVNEYMIYLLELIDGIKPLSQLKDLMSSAYSISEDEVEAVIESMVENHILTEVKQINILSGEDQARFTRQINYFSEFLGSEEAGHIAQKKLFVAKVLIFGCGAIGGDIAVELAMAGIRNMTLFDIDTVEDSDVSRHIYYKNEYTGLKKTEALKKHLEAIDHKMNIQVINQYLSPADEIEELIRQHDFIVNTLDEPYIGYTSAKISRICIRNNLPHFIAGGFDAHLASTGELIIPFVTPCAECYADYFKVTLKDWKPKTHPVKVRYKKIGGLSSMSLFSASYAAIEIVKTITGLIDMGASFKVRGELLFDDYSLTYLNVKRNPACPVCGENNR